MVACNERRWSAIRRCISAWLLVAANACDRTPTDATTGIPAGVSVARATDLGVIAATQNVLGRDGGYSGTFAGNVVWLFGDTFLAQPDSLGRTLISDSWTWTTDRDATDGIASFQQRTDSYGAATQLLPETVAEQSFDSAHAGTPCAQQPCGARWALWPGAMVEDTIRHRALVFYQLVSALPGAFNFQALGSSVATWQTFSDRPTRSVLGKDPAHPDLLFSATEPAFGSAAIVRGDTLFAYGCNTVGVSKPCTLGRVALGHVLERDAWDYSAGSGIWSAKLSDATPALSANNIMSVSWNAYLQRYLAVYSAPFSRDVHMRTSITLEGPWSDPVTAFTALPPADGSNAVYDAQSHQEYDSDGGRTCT